MRILTRTQYDAICDIVTSANKTIKDQSKEIEELKKKLADKEKTCEYLNEKIFERNREYIELQQKIIKGTYMTTLDFPATTKQPENKF